MNEFRVSGYVHHIGDVYTSGTFAKVEVILHNVRGMYQDYITVQFFNELVTQAQALKHGAFVEVVGRISGRLANDNSQKAWINLVVVRCDVKALDPLPKVDQQQQPAQSVIDQLPLF